MKERPINLRPDEVRSILAGRKTQFRRVVKWPLLSKSDGSKKRMLVEADAPLLVEILKENTRRHPHLQFCQLGAPGDRLWVRECWADVRGMGFESHLFPLGIAYRADCTTAAGLRIAKEYGVVWSPSVHMPRWACRIILEVVSVRVERLQDISEEDAIAEGYKSQSIMEHPDAGRIWFRGNWQSVNGPGSWEANPWVWVVEFRKLEVLP